MTKNNKSKVYRPFVSVCTPTFNRRPFIENMFQCFRNQKYPKDRIEWIIIDDGTDKINDLIAKSKIPQISYYSIDGKMTLGAKRNLMHSYAKGSIIVYMDDDDYYPPDRISHAVERLESNKKALCAGSSEIYIYFKGLNSMVQCGPYGPNHATAGTFAFRRELLQQTKYEDHAALAEERAFLKDYTIPFVQLDPMKSILVFSHEHNTFDKRKMLENPHPDYLKTSAKSVDDFIKNKNEDGIKDFFMNKIDGLLEKYEPGLPKMKPDVLKQMKQIEADRAEMEKNIAKQQQGPIVIQRPGEPPVQLSQAEVVQIIQQQQQAIQDLTKENDSLKASKYQQTAPSEELIDLKRQCQELQTMVIQLQKQIMEKSKSNSIYNVMQNSIKPNEMLSSDEKLTEVSKLVPEVMVEAD